MWFFFACRPSLGENPGCTTVAGCLLLALVLSDSVVSRSLAQRLQFPVTGLGDPLVLIAHGDAVLVAVNVRWLATLPPVLGGRRWAAGSLHADEGPLDVAVRDAQPVKPSLDKILSALVLRLGAGHGQVGVELFTGRLSFSVDNRLLQEYQTAAGTAAEAGGTATRIWNTTQVYTRRSSDDILSSLTPQEYNNYLPCLVQGRDLFAAQAGTRLTC